MDRYACYALLKEHETKGVDYLIETQNGSSSFALLAPHGGSIEPGTDHIARAVAGKEHTYWAFKGIKERDNKILHITSTRFDEPEGIKTAKSAQTAIAIHGCRGKDSIVYVGGRNRKLKTKIQNALLQAGFNARAHIKEGLKGESPSNLCNRCITGRGVQLEITEGLRKKMFLWADHHTPQKTAVFFRFVSTLRTSLAANLFAPRHH